MSYTSLLVSLILFTIVLLVFGVFGYWLHLRVSRLEQSAMNNVLVQHLGGSLLSQPHPPQEFPPGLYEVPMEEFAEAYEDAEEDGMFEQELEEQDVDDDRLPVILQESLVESDGQDTPAPVHVAESTEATVNYEELSVVQLKELCEQRGLHVGRKDRKADIIAKLQHHDQENRQPNA